MKKFQVLFIIVMIAALLGLGGAMSTPAHADDLETSSISTAQEMGKGGKGKKPKPKPTPKPEDDGDDDDDDDEPRPRRKPGPGDGGADD